MKHGVPFAPFWDALHVDFDGYVGHELSYHNWDQWRDTYPPETYPVVAMKGAPAPFPMRIEHWGLQKYVKFSEEIVSQTDLFVKGFMGGKKFVGIHLRNGPDWAIACEIFDDTPSMKTGNLLRH
jgi:peptide-O-fucosyltransferase